MSEETKCCHDHDHDHEHAHTHEHSHDGHTHTHEHSHDGHTHTHEHSHDGHTHDHDHGHTHSHGTAESVPAEVVALLTYMADHNEHHAAELADMGEKLRALGKTEAADKIAEGVEEFGKANAKLNEALKLVKEM